MREWYICDKCSKVFYNREECVKHEGECNINMPIKGMFISLLYMDNGERLKIEVNEYPKAVRVNGDEVRLVDSEHVDSIPISNLELDRIHRCGYEYDGDYVKTVGIYTMNFDKEYERKCINKLIEYRRNWLRNEYEDYTKMHVVNLKAMTDKDYDVVVDENSEKMYDYYD